MTSRTLFIDHMHLTICAIGWETPSVVAGPFATVREVWDAIDADFAGPERDSLRRQCCEISAYTLPRSRAELVKRILLRQEPNPEGMSDEALEAEHVLMSERARARAKREDGYWPGSAPTAAA
jgi:hypothetical protein